MNTFEFDSITTVSDRDYFLSELDLMVENLYTGVSTENYKTFMEKYVVAERLQTILSYIEWQKVEIKFIEDLRKPLQDLIKELNHMQILEMHVAVDLTEKELREISQHANNIIGRRVLIESFTDPILIGGATFGYGGRYKNYSLGSEIEKVMEKATPL